MKKLALLSDQDLFEKVKAGDKTAFEALFLRYHSRLLHFLRILQADQVTAEDILQELFVDIWLKREEIMVHSSVKAYLYTAAKNRFFSALKTIKSSPIEEYPLLVSHTFPNPEEQLICDEIATGFDRQVAALPMQARQAFQLQLNGKKQKEIAQDMGISENTVEKHIGSARKKLRQAFAIYLG
ncbi:RNA polymerase sigma factor [Dyadobacter bucti]|uniref:RNA polymerase sigma factor n=1 Tax=Dyadobacter bucti TaxID=2572203 RepID=UPI0011093D59|nr:sigma-70 family RNA polymerase sigma factor [Dyadobacter bucti]